MKFKLVSWNVRGLNNKDKRRLVKSVMGGWNADIICLQETKLERDVIEEVRQIWGGRWVKYACLGLVKYFGQFPYAEGSQAHLPTKFKSPPTKLSLPTSGGPSDHRKILALFPSFLFPPFFFLHGEHHILCSRIQII